MSRFTNNTLTTTLALTLVASLATTTFACGRGGGGYSGRTSSRLSIAYSRSAPHMQSQAYGYNNNHRSSYRYSQPIHTQPVFTQPAPTQIVQPQVVQPQIAQPQVSQPQTIQPQVTQSQATPAPSAQQSALAALAGGQTSNVSMPQFQPAPNNGAAAHVGIWNASVGNNATVRLELKQDGGFTWVANNGGKVSTFAGSFTITNGRLTLIRSNDQQQLAGAWTANTNGSANFKLDGDTTNGLSFSRS